MLQTYKAILKGSQLEWNGEAPETEQNEQPINVFITILDDETAAKELRPFGLAAGEFIVPTDFDEPLPEEILAAFEGE